VKIYYSFFVIVTFVFGSLMEAIFFGSRRRAGS